MKEEDPKSKKKDKGKDIESNEGNNSFSISENHSNEPMDGLIIEGMDEENIKLQYSDEDYEADDEISEKTDNDIEKELSLDPLAIFNPVIKPVAEYVKPKLELILNQRKNIIDSGVILGSTLANYYMSAENPLATALITSGTLAFSYMSELGHYGKYCKRLENASKALRRNGEKSAFLSRPLSTKLLAYNLQSISLAFGVALLAVYAVLTALDIQSLAASIFIMLATFLPPYLRKCNVGFIARAAKAEEKLCEEKHILFREEDILKEENEKLIKDLDQKTKDLMISKLKIEELKKREKKFLLEIPNKEKAQSKMALDVDSELDSFKEKLSEEQKEEDEESISDEKLNTDLELIYEAGMSTYEKFTNESEEIADAKRLVILEKRLSFLRKLEEDGKLDREGVIERSKVQEEIEEIASRNEKRAAMVYEEDLLTQNKDKIRFEGFLTEESTKDEKKDFDSEGDKDTPAKTFYAGERKTFWTSEKPHKDTSTEQAEKKQIQPGIFSLRNRKRESKDM